VRNCDICCQVFLRLYATTHRKVGRVRICCKFSLQWTEKSAFHRKSEFHRKVRTSTSVINFYCGYATTHRKVAKVRICSNFSQNLIESAKLRHLLSTFLFLQHTRKWLKSKFVCKFILQSIEKCGTVSVINFSCGCAPTEQKVGKVRICCKFTLQTIEKVRNCVCYQLFMWLCTNRPKSVKSQNLLQFQFAMGWKVRIW